MDLNSILTVWYGECYTIPQDIEGCKIFARLHVAQFPKVFVFCVCVCLGAPYVLDAYAYNSNICA